MDGQLKGFIDDEPNEILIDAYHDTANMQIIITKPIMNYPEPIEEITENSTLFLQQSEIIINDLEHPQAKNFILGNSLGIFKKTIEKNGRTYSILKMSEKKLKELDPVGYQQYIDLFALKQYNINNNVNIKA